MVEVDLSLVERIVRAACSIHAQFILLRNSAQLADIDTLSGRQRS